MVSTLLVQQATEKNQSHTLDLRALASSFLVKLATAVDGISVPFLIP